MTVSESRIETVSEAIASIGYDGIVAFDRTEPEYDTLQYLYETFESESYVQLLAICAATQDYQLNGDAQRFWNTLEQVASEFESLDSTQAVRDLLGDFMRANVNARLNEQKRDRLVTLFQSGFDEWFLANHRSAAPIEVWERLADDMDTRRQAKTVVFAMKVYDIAHQIRHGEYLEFPDDIPIPCDLQVKRVARTAGIVTTDDTDAVMTAWARVMQSVSNQLDRHVSLLRIDSLVWQAGQIIGDHEADREAAMAALHEHFATVGLDRSSRERLAGELTAEM